jgi:hypothetical protein
VIQGYPGRPSVVAGGTVTIHVSTDAPWFRVELYRQGAVLEPVETGIAWREGSLRDAPPAPQPYDWPGFAIEIPASWKAGCYVAILIEGDDRQRDRTFPDRTRADARSARLLFVVRRSPMLAAAPILYKIPLFTYQAYNIPDVSIALAERMVRGHRTDALTLYTGSDSVSLVRPGGGTGGTPWDAFHAPDVYDAGSPRHVFEHWDAKFVAWLEASKYDVDYITDLDLHELPSYALARHRLIVSSGHDEYWSDDMRWRVENFIAGGGNVAFFAANLLWWRVAVTPDGSTITRVGHFDDVVDPRASLPYDEADLTGVTFAHGGGRWVGERDATGFTVVDADHWAFTGTGLLAGDTFGAEDRLVGYECDGQPGDGSRRIPEHFQLLARADISTWTVDGIDGEILGSGCAVMGCYERGGGTVFTAATTDWPRLLGQGHPSVERITRNVIDRLSTTPAPTPLDVRSASS